MSKELSILQKQAENLFELEKFDELLNLLSDEVLEKHNNAELYAWRSRGHQRFNSEFEKSIKYAEKAIQANSGYFMGYLARGNGYDDIGDYDKAISDFDKTIDLNPYYSGAFNNRGISWYYKGEYDKAINDFNKAIELKPDNANAFIGRGNSWHLRGEYDKAISDYGKAIELKPDDAVAFNNRGLSWHHKGEYDKSIFDHDKAIELKPDFADAYYNRGYSHRLNGKDIEKAKSDYECYLSLSPEKDDIWAKRAKEIIAELEEKLKDHKVSEISEITEKIKKLLFIENGSITHYTSLSTVKILNYGSSTCSVRSCRS